MSGQLVNRVIGAGAAGVAAVFAVAPLANADPSAPAPHATTAPRLSGAPVGGQRSQLAPKPAAATPEVTPDFGFQKVRVGVQIKSGAFVPDGTNTGDTTVTIVETGPNAETASAVNGTSCQTVPGSEAPGSTETFCDFLPTDAAGARAAVARAGLVVPRDVPPINHDYLAFPGDTVTFTQSTVNANLLIDPDPQTVGPCVVAPPQAPNSATRASTTPTCPGEGTAEIVTFNDAGLPPTAKNDTATDVSGKTVDIDVLGNDVTHGAPVSIDEITAPHHGTVTQTGAQSAAAARPFAAARTAPADPPAIAYTSSAGFVGTDSFTYTITTANGSSRATVHVTVVAPPPTAVDDTATTTSGQAVTIDVLGNDNANGGGALHVAAVGKPAHGSAAISNGAIDYIPDASFVGTDSFTYTAQTAFGSDTATVTVTVSAKAALSDTGSSDDRLAGIGVLLLLVGGSATVVGRRRYRAKHA
jgi:hypothetical protein